jgi:protein phosphatase
MTRDHSLLEDYKEARPGMTEDEQKKFPHRNVITRALGMKESVQVDISAAEIKDGDIFLLCSDGLSGPVETPTLRDLLKVGVDLDDAAHKLVAAANNAGGPDNITVLVLECRMN